MSEENKPSILEVDIGDSSKYYATPDYLNAIEQVNCFFMDRRNLNEAGVIRALRMYADEMEAREAI